MCVGRCVFGIKLHIMYLRRYTASRGHYKYNFTTGAQIESIRTQYIQPHWKQESTLFFLFSAVTQIQLGVCCSVHLVGQVQAGFGVADRHDDGEVSVLTGDVQGWVTVAILMVHAATTSEETVDDFNLTPPYSQMEGRVAVLETHTHHTSCMYIKDPSSINQVLLWTFCADLFFRFQIFIHKPKAKI